MTVLGIDTSCDDTCIACIKERKIISNIVLSQILHSQYGGVIPELAARDHIKNISSIAEKAVEEIGFNNIEGTGVTYGPGLIGSLLVGLSFAKAISFALSIPFYGVNHIEAHIFSLFIENEIEFPFIALIVSGGHTELVLVEEKGKYKLIGTTLDDAAGEAFDKVARMLGFSYPGGPAIEKLTQSGGLPNIEFPRPQVFGYNFSFSGLKTAVLYYIRDHKSDIKKRVPDIAASFQEAVCDSLIDKTIKASDELNISRIGVVGGVAANLRLREKFKQTGKKIYFPEPKFCTDNGVMVALCAQFYLSSHKYSSYGLKADASAKLNKE
jgi:N6-L-threonylcarbamoyladenine synthase